MKDNPIIVKIQKEKERTKLHEEEKTLMNEKVERKRK